MYLGAECRSLGALIAAASAVEQQQLRQGEGGGGAGGVRGMAWVGGQVSAGWVNGGGKVVKRSVLGLVCVCVCVLFTYISPKGV